MNSTKPQNSTQVENKLNGTQPILSGTVLSTGVMLNNSGRMMIVGVCIILLVSNIVVSTVALGHTLPTSSPWIDGSIILSIATSSLVLLMTVVKVGFFNTWSDKPHYARVHRNVAIH
jgi:hypothetical protein